MWRKLSVYVNSSRRRNCGITLRGYAILDANVLASKLLPRSAFVLINTNTNMYSTILLFLWTFMRCQNWISIF